MGKRKLRKYRVGMDSETYAISLVESPAIEEDFIYMAEQEPVKIQMSSDEKHMLYGAVLVPDKAIYRINEEGDEYYLEFTKESIERMSQDFMKEYRQKNITLDHEEEASEIYVVESWIKEDLYKDKSVALGLSETLPVGTWVVGVKVNNIETWERVKSGELKGFSVESLISLEDFSKQDNDNMDFEADTMSKFMDEIKKMIKEALKKEEEPVEQIEEVQLEETPVEAIPEPVEAPKEVEVNNDIPEPKEEPVEPENKPVEEEHKNDADNKLVELVESLKAEIDALKKLNGNLNDKVKSLEKEPSAKPVNTAAGAKKGSTYENWREQMRNMIG